MNELLLRLQRESADPLAAFVYDLQALRAHCRRLRAALPAGVELFYAVKANSELPLLRVISSELDGFEVASGGELSLVAEHFPKVHILFGGPGKTDTELRQALEHPVEVLHVESLYELERLADAQADVLLRVNPALSHAEDSPMLMAGKPSPFGLEPSDLGPAFELLRRSSLRCLGFHLHTRSLQLDAGDHLRLINSYVALAAEWSEAYGVEVRQLNVGGGIGVNYREPGRQFAWEEFCANLPSFPLRFECGRFVTAFCGYYAMEVLDLKWSHGEAFAVCRGGTHHFRLPAAQGHSHPFEVVPGRRRGPRLRDVALNVVGQLCTPKDRLATGTPVEEVSVGDLLVFPLAGAYGWNISHHDFLRHPPPVVAYWDSSVHASTRSNTELT